MTKYYACLAGITLLALVSSGQSREQGPIEWRTFEVPDLGTRIQYPASIFTPAGQPETGLGQRFERADGRAVLSIYARPNEAGENPRTYLRKNLRVDRSALDYVRIARHSSPSRQSVTARSSTVDATFPAVHVAQFIALT
jgi:hypothetical protein